MMSSTLPPITIVGAGLSGITLGLCLKQKGIPASIYDCATSPPRYSYGIVLRSATYRPLLSLLRMDEATFRRRTAVDSQQGRNGDFPSRSSPVPTDSFRCHRGRLEAILRQGLMISWNKKLRAVRKASGSKTVTATFENGDRRSTECLIGCDGPHSITRKSLSSALKLQVLPYVVFNGKRDISLRNYIDKIHDHLEGNTSAQTLKGNVLLEISVNDINGSQVSLSYTYSRPALEINDPLHNPDRPMTGATKVPEEFFTELADLPKLQPPFNEIFNVEAVRQDRLLHWLMRAVSPNLFEATRLAGLNVVLIGDAAHATPILGSEGANIAIQDGIDLAEHIATRGTGDLGDFSKEKFETWEKSVEDSKRRIEDMHTSISSHI